MKIRNKLTGAFGITAAVFFVACGDDVTNTYTSDAGTTLTTDTLTVTEVVKNFDTVTVTEILRTLDTLKTTVVINDTIKDTVKVELVPAKEPGELVFGKVNLTYAQYFNGEINDISPETDATTGLYNTKSVPADLDGYDAFTSATLNKYSKFSTVNANVGESSVEFLGVSEVDVAISKSLLEDVLENGSNSDNSDLYALVSAVDEWTSDEPESYKVINADGSLSKTQGKVSLRTPSTATITGLTNYGDYQIDFNSTSIYEVTTANVQGVVLEDEFGDKYGLIPLAHIWLQVQELAFSIGENNIHGNLTPYAQFANIEGKRIVKVTYLLKDSHSIELSTDLFVPFKSSITAGTATVTVTTQGRGSSTTVSDFNESTSFTLGDSIVFKAESIVNASSLKLTAYGVSSGKTVTYTDISNGGTFSTSSPYVIFDSSILPNTGKFVFKFEDQNGLQASTSISLEFSEKNSEDVVVEE